MRFQIGHTPEVERMRIRMGHGVVGEAAKRREAVLVNDVTQASNYINVNPDVRSEMAVPLIVKNRVIGVIDIQSEQVGYFRPEHLRMLTLTASRIGQAIENARLYSRASRQAQTLAVLNEISRELTSILNLDALLERDRATLAPPDRLPDVHHPAASTTQDDELDIRYSIRFGERFSQPSSRAASMDSSAPPSANASSSTSRDVRKDPRYVIVNPESRSEMVVPLIYKDKVIGVLDLEHTRTNYFNEDHERTLVTLAAQIAIAIENARLYQRVARQEQRLERDLAMATRGAASPAAPGAS